MILNEDCIVVQAICTRVDQANLQKIKFRRGPKKLERYCERGQVLVLKSYVKYKDDGRVQQIGAASTQEQEDTVETALLDESREDPSPEGDQPPQEPRSKTVKKRAE